MASIPVFNSLIQAEAFIAAHPGLACAYIATVTYDPTAPLFATQAEAYEYLTDNIGSTASWNAPPLTTAASIAYPGPTLNLTQLAAELTTLRAAVASQTSFIGISAQDAAPIQASLSSCLNDLNGLLETAETVMSSAEGVANVVAGGVDFLMVQQFGLYLNVAVQVPDLIDMRSFLARMEANLTVETAAIAPAAVSTGPSKFTLDQSTVGGPDVLGTD